MTLADDALARIQPLKKKKKRKEINEVLCVHSSSPLDK